MLPEPTVYLTSIQRVSWNLLIFFVEDVVNQNISLQKEFEYVEQNDNPLEVGSSESKDTCSNNYPDSAIVGLETSCSIVAAEETIRKEPSSKTTKNHPIFFIIGSFQEKVTTRIEEKLDYQKMISNFCYIFTIEPKNVKKAINDEFWIITI